VSRVGVAPMAFDSDGLQRGLHELADQVIAKL